MDYSIVIPVYNSSNTLPLLLKELNLVMNKMNAEFEIVFVDDCSNDQSWNILKEIKSQNNHVKIIRLANNVGQWMATLAGIKKTGGKLIITIDDDLEYETDDIALLIRSYHQSDVYLIYGIPVEKQNKNLSYKLFFKIRDRFLRFFFDKIQTESFKIFKREIYFDDEGMYSHLHFEAYTKFTLAKKYVGHVDVNYRSRYFGNSNHTLLMKAMLMIKYGIEYYKSPFKFPLYSLFALLTVYFGLSYFKIEYFSVMILIKYSIVMLSLLIVGILGKYLSSLYFKLKGLPEYIIIEEL